MSSESSGIDSVLQSFRVGQQELSKLVQLKQQLSAQEAENQMVLKELNFLNDDSKVYKVFGPALVRQDSQEARINVESRINKISSEIKRIDGQIKDLEEKMDKQKAEIVSARMGTGQHAQIRT